MDNSKEPSQSSKKRRGSYKKMNMAIDTSTPTKHAVSIELVTPKAKANAAEILDRERRQTQGESYLQEQIAAFNRK